MREMVTADDYLFHSHSGLQRHAAMGVVNALLATEDPGGSTQNPRVLAPEGEGGVHQVPLSATSRQPQNFK